MERSSDDPKRQAEVTDGQTQMPTTMAMSTDLTLPDAEPMTIFVIGCFEMPVATWRATFQQEGWAFRELTTGESFLSGCDANGNACVIVSDVLQDMSGLAFLHRVAECQWRLPIIVVIKTSDVSAAVQAMKAGAADVLVDPGPAAIVDCATRLLGPAREADRTARIASDYMAGLTARQREIMALIIAGHPNKNIAASLGVSRRTIENHRASIMRKTGATSLPALTRLALAAQADRCGPMR